MDDRVEDVLLPELASLRRWLRAGSTGVLFAGEGKWDPFAWADGALDALVAIGVVSEEEAGRWRARFRETMRGVPDAAVDQQVRERAHAYVGELLARIPRDRKAGLEASFEFEDVLNALRHIEIFSDGELRVWFDRLNERLGRVQGPTRGDGERQCTLSELRRVVVGPPERRGGIRVVGFEMYDDGVVLRWHLVRLAPDAQGHVPPLPDEVEGEEAARRAREPSFALNDDLGTAYRFHSGGAGRAGSAFGPSVSTGHALFTPSVPPQARTLSAATDAFQFEVVL